MIVGRYSRYGRELNFLPSFINHFPTHLSLEGEAWYFKFIMKLSKIISHSHFYFFLSFLSFFSRGGRGGYRELQKYVHFKSNKEESQKEERDESEREEGWDIIRVAVFDTPEPDLNSLSFEKRFNALLSSLPIDPPFLVCYFQLYFLSFFILSFFILSFLIAFLFYFIFYSYFFFFVCVLCLCLN